jgi:uncharacterized membrane protein
MDARLSAKKTADAQNAKSAGMTAGNLRMKQALARNNIQVIPECFNRPARCKRGIQKKQIEYLGACSEVVYFGIFSLT